MAGFRPFLQRVRIRLWCLATTCLVGVLPSWGQGTDYNKLEHVDAAYLSQVAAFSSTMAFTNFQLVDVTEGHEPDVYMGTLFFDLASPMTYTTHNSAMGTLYLGHYVGAVGFYMYNVTDGIQSGERYLSPAAPAESFFVSEVDFTPSIGLIYDGINLVTPDGSELWLLERAMNVDPATVAMIDSEGQTLFTLGEIGFPFAVSSGTIWENAVTFTEGGQETARFESTDRILGNGLVASVVPEPSGVLLVGAAGMVALLRRRRV